MLKEMQPLLYLVHRIPYPPNKGDKIRSYNILRYLSQFYDIYLGTSIDTPEDIQYQQKVETYCKQTHFEIINPKINKIKSLKGLFKNQALTIPYYSSKDMQQWVDTVLKENNITKALAFSSPMAQFIIDNDSLYKVMDLIDIDSDKWKHYSHFSKGIMSWVYARESTLLFQYEKQIYQKFNHSIFVSAAETERFKSYVKDENNKTHPVLNGIDLEFFNPDISYTSPYKNNEKVLVFIGTMDYWPNVDAVIWFAETIWPKIKQNQSDAKFYIVGRNPSEKVKQLKKLDGIIVTGSVKDIRPYIHYAITAIFPLRIGLGVNNKVLEALAMNKKVISTSIAMKGIHEKQAYNVKIADDENSLIQESIAALHESNDNNNEPRKILEKYYNWDKNLMNIKLLLNYPEN